jgi:uncharacterized protein YcgI (DUF1989 family)
MFRRLLILLAATTSVYGTTMPPGDKAAPVISDLTVVPASGGIGTPYTITLHVTDPQGPDFIDNHLYQIRERMEAITLDINDRGVEGDAVAHDGIYTAESIVPHTAVEGVHTFTVFVKDTAGRHSNVLLYRFTVTKGNSVLQTDGGESPGTGRSTISAGGPGGR